MSHGTEPGSVTAPPAAGANGRSVASPGQHAQAPATPPPASAATQPDGPRPELRFKRRVRPIAMLRELVGAHELILALTERDFRARYKQTKVGVVWAVLTPLLLLGAFWIFSQTAADFDTNGAPYLLFAFVALVPWTFFSNAIASGALSITQNLSLVNKVYCPREVFPLASVATAAVDALISLVLLAAMFALYGEAPQSAAAWVPLLLLVQLTFMIGVALVLSALVVYVRDVRQILPMALQFALFATPIAYSFDEVPHGWRPLASAVNPLAPIVESYRVTVLQGHPPEWGLVGIAAAASLVWLVGGYLLFKRLETGFADVA
ncbi:MAG: ABC transporter permease [Acidimicrobiales bacterium]